MKRNQIRRVVIHNAENADQSALSEKISAFYAQVIERRLSKLPLTAEQKIAVVDRIIENLKSREADYDRQYCDKGAAQEQLFR